MKDMSISKFKFKERRFRKSSKEFVCTLVRYGNHDRFGQFPSDNYVRKSFEINGYDWDRLIDRCRDPEEVPRPEFVNYIERTGWYTYGEDVQLQSGTGASVNGAGAVFPFSYYIIWKSAQAAFERAVEHSLYGEFLAACALGVASIEAYINHQAIQFNRKGGDLLHDSKTAPVKFDEKLKTWITKITGRKLDIGTENWQHFRKLRLIRDDQVVHPKTSGIGITYEEMTGLMNLYRTGINGVLIDLHKHFNDRIDYPLVKAGFMPEVELVTMPLPIR